MPSRKSVTTTITLLSRDKVLGVVPENWFRDALGLFRIPFSDRFRTCSADSVSKSTVEAAADLSAASFSRRSFFNRAILSRSASASGLWDKCVLWCPNSAETKIPMIVVSPSALQASSRCSPSTRTKRPSAGRTRMGACCPISRILPANKLFQSLF